MANPRGPVLLTLAPLLAPLLATTLAATPAAAAAQLRPMEAVPWRNGPETMVMAGASAYGSARAPMAGVEGTLYEAAVVQLSAAFGRAAVRVQAARHVLDPARRYAPPARTTEDRGLERLSDFSDVTLETLLYFSTPDWLMAGMRLGSRVPSSDNEVGLDRDQADVYGTLMLGGGGEAVWIETEAGVGVHGSRGTQRLEQQDPLLYSAFLRAHRGPITARIGLIGHVFWTNDWSTRGNENMGEWRAGLRVGHHTFLDAAAVAGLTRTSPDWGLRLRVGRRFGQ